MSHHEYSVNWEQFGTELHQYRSAICNEVSVIQKGIDKMAQNLIKSLLDPGVPHKVKNREVEILLRMITYLKREMKSSSIIDFNIWIFSILEQRTKELETAITNIQELIKIGSLTHAELKTMAYPYIGDMQNLFFGDEFSYGAFINRIRKEHNRIKEEKENAECMQN